MIKIDTAVALCLHRNIKRRWRLNVRSNTALARANGASSEVRRSRSAAYETYASLIWTGSPLAGRTARCGYEVAKHAETPGLSDDLGHSRRPQKYPAQQESSFVLPKSVTTMARYGTFPFQWRKYSTRSTRRFAPSWNHRTGIDPWSSPPRPTLTIRTPLGRRADSADAGSKPPMNWVDI